MLQIKMGWQYNEFEGETWVMADTVAQARLKLLRKLQERYGRDVTFQYIALAKEVRARSVLNIKTKPLL